MNLLCFFLGHIPQGYGIISKGTCICKRCKREYKVHFTLISTGEPVSRDQVLNHPEVKAFADYAKNYLQAIYDEAISDLSPSEKAEFDSWWNRKSNNTHFSKKANSAVLWAIGQGAG